MCGQMIWGIFITCIENPYCKDCANAQSFLCFLVKICAICLLTNRRAAGSCLGPLYYTTNPQKCQAQNRRQCAQTLTSRIAQPAGAAGVGRHSPSTRPTQFSAHMLTYGSLLLTPVTRQLYISPQNFFKVKSIPAYMHRFCHIFNLILLKISLSSQNLCLVHTK